jgi:hypothetical protein
MMKKIILALFLGVTHIAAFSNGANGSDIKGPGAFNHPRAYKASIIAMTVLDNPAYLGTFAADTKNINAKATKDFRTRFANTGNAMWFSDAEGFVSYFIKDGYEDRAFYDKKGRLIYSQIFYGENKLSRDIKVLVRSFYSEFAIYGVEEVQTTDDLVYIIHLEDKSRIRIVKVKKDGEIETVQELIKR